MLAAALVAAGCAAGGSYGRLRPSQEVGDMFVKGPLSAEYNYYYSGAANKPRAIIGIDRKYTLETERWKQVDPESGQIRTMMDALTGYRGIALVNFGSVILDPEGNTIGVWYSKEADTTTIKMLGDNVVSIYPPTRREGTGPKFITR
jgi:hypothetical protein